MKQKDHFKRQVFEMLEGGLRGSPAARTFSWIVITLILLSVSSMVVESYEEANNRFGGFLWVMETITVAVFTLEFILGLWTADLRYPGDKHPRLRFLTSFMAIVELLAILPFYLGLILSDPGLLELTEVFQLLRLLHLLKLGEYSPTLQALGSAFRATSRSILLCFVVCFLGMLAASIVLYRMENPLQPKVFPNVPACLWWAICQAANVRADSAYPMTVAGQFCAGAIRLLGIGMIAIPAGLLAAGYHRERVKRQDEKNPKAFCPFCGKKISSDDL